ncbi:hypothetical protein QV13_15440 [Mesorhizobium hungaricum]|uniref:Uncharacterized protein n=1 Tax=Mesorhizobium hungaricum TaxID=1566387 RepID=A0A1C2DNA8_9HYPH|nr:hypothetical protein QV13_15440 [Mesorhizobium hungaricum]
MARSSFWTVQTAEPTPHVSPLSTRTEVPAVLNALGPMGSGSALGFASLARNDEGVGWDKPATAGRRSKTTSATDRLDSASALPTCAERL